MARRTSMRSNTSGPGRAARPGRNRAATMRGTSRRTNVFRPDANQLSGLDRMKPASPLNLPGIKDGAQAAPGGMGSTDYSPEGMQNKFSTFTPPTDPTTPSRSMLGTIGGSLVSPPTSGGGTEWVNKGNPVDPGSGGISPWAPEPNWDSPLTPEWENKTHEDVLGSLPYYGQKSKKPLAQENSENDQDMELAFDPSSLPFTKRPLLPQGNIIDIGGGGGPSSLKPGSSPFDDNPGAPRPLWGGEFDYNWGDNWQDNSWLTPEPEWDEDAWQQGGDDKPDTDWWEGLLDEEPQDWNNDGEINMLDILWNNANPNNTNMDSGEIIQGLPTNMAKGRNINDCIRAALQSGSSLEEAKGSCSGESIESE